MYAFKIGQKVLARDLQTGRNIPAIIIDREEKTERNIYCVKYDYDGKKIWLRTEQIFEKL